LVLKNHLDLYITLMKRAGPISRKLKEMIAVVVSSINKCKYWITHHGAGLRKILLKKEIDNSQIDKLLKDLISDYKKADISKSELLVLEYISKLTEKPWDINIQDIEKLKQNNFSDREIHDICSIASYFSFVNRIASGLGVELE